MNRSIWGSLPMQLLKLLASMIIAWFFCICIASACLPTDPATGALPESYGPYYVIAAVIIALIVNAVIDFNAVQHLKARISKLNADILSVQEMNTSLIDKAERVADKYRISESTTYEHMADARATPSKGKKIRTSQDFRAVMENYPELKANIHTQKLMQQMETCEATLLRSKTDYSGAVERYNTKIHLFPVMMMRWVFRWKDIEQRSAIAKDELVSDEELGI